MKSSFILDFKMLFLALSVLLLGCRFSENEDLVTLPVPTLKIGVMLPYSGEYASDWNNALDWAVENINHAGGVSGCNIELVKNDIASGNVAEIADKLISDTTIMAVIGPFTSTQVFDVADKFMSARKLLIAPVASAASISRAYAGRNYFWRLTEPDISQTKTLLLLAQKGGAKSVALITEESEYGASFEDWFGYFATELGLTVTSVNVIAPDDVKACVGSWTKTINTHPDAVIAALNLPALNIEIARAYRANGQQARLLFSDVACLPALVTNLGSLAENLEGTTISSDPASGFDISYNVRYNKYPGAYLANMYDAVVLIALALESSKGVGGEALVTALKKVVSGREGTCKWQRDEIDKAINLIKNGIYPDLKGASSDLNFDELYFTDVCSTSYGHWRVDAGQFIVTEFYTSDASGRISSTSAAYRVISEKKQQFLSIGTWPTLLPKKGLYAFLMATSKDYWNYRHQADVLNAYQLLKSKGVDDDHIILVIADDLAYNRYNNLPGVVRNEINGPNLYYNLKVDYKLDDISSKAIFNIFTGAQTAETPVVFKTSPSDNILIFTSGHGSPDGISIDGNSQETLTPAFWQSVFKAMYGKQNYRLIFWALETCYSGKTGEAISTPGVMLMTGANPYESSYAVFYDAAVRAYLADKFAYSINNAMAAAPNLLFSELYERCFSYVSGSHVSFYNYQNFGNIYQLRLNEFTNP